MSQLGVTKSFRNTTLSSAVSSWRGDSSLRPRNSDPSKGTPAPQPAWQRHFAARDDDSGGSQRPRPVPSIAENDDGFTPVSHAKSKRHGYNDEELRAPASQAIRGVSRGLNRPSAAAVARSACGPYQRHGPSNRSFIPDPEQEFFRQRREANQFVRIPAEKYKLGMIIRAPLHEQDSAVARRAGAGGGSSVATAASEATKAEHYKTESRMGTIFTKQRKMIVVALHTEHYVTIPLYTHNGRGLVNKRRPEEFVSVKDHRYKEDFVKLSKHDPLVTEMVRDGIDLFDAKSTAHLAYPVSRRYALPVIYEGHLRSSSLRILVTLYNRYAEIEAS
ncbi:MAG: hypothetical protein Q9169_000767 [Polycauliona sp. 2 TL-2023]